MNLEDIIRRIPPRDRQQLCECALKIEGGPGCTKPGCQCNGEPFIVVWLIAPNKSIHGAAIQSLDEVDKLITKLRRMRNQLWSKGT